MVAKVLFIIIAGAGLSTSVLVARQQRLQAASDMTRAIERSAQHDRTLWDLRARISRVTSPANVRAMADEIGPMAPIPRELCPPEEADPAPPQIRPSPRPKPSEEPRYTAPAPQIAAAVAHRREGARRAH